MKKIAFAEVNKRLKQLRAGEWSLVKGTDIDPDQLITVSARHWVQHSCGFEVYRVLQSVWRYPSSTHKVSNTADDCHYCSGKSPRRYIEGRNDLYDLWLQKKTDGQLQFISGQLTNSSSRTSFTALCTTCGTQFDDANEAKLSKQFNGCPTCLENRRNRQRAWCLEDAIAVVNRRGFILLDEPQNYADPVMMLSPSGERIHQNIIDLCSQYPGTKDGFQRLNSSIKTQDWPQFNQGLPYSSKDRKTVVDLSTEKSAREVAIQLGRSEGSVRQFAIKNDIAFEDKEHGCHQQRYQINESAFCTHCETSAFFAGLLAADGSLYIRHYDTKKDTYTTKLEIQVVDEPTLTRLASFLSYTGKLTYRFIKNVSDNRGLYACLNITSEKIYDDLISYHNLSPNKSRTLQPQAYDQLKYEIAYLAGLIEGDGHIKIAGANEINLSIISASKAMQAWLIDILTELGGEAPAISANSLSKKALSFSLSNEPARKALRSLLKVKSRTMSRK